MGLLSWVSHNPELWLTWWPIGLGPSWLLLEFWVVLTPPSQGPVAGQEMGEEARSCFRGFPGLISRETPHAHTHLGFL